MENFNFTFFVDILPLYFLNIFVVDFSSSEILIKHLLFSVRFSVVFFFFCNISAYFFL